ncbi:MAG: HAD hydrolase family protein [Bacteroidales bacterium]|nr:HAD hydrolase family protein [Bacteroidales bacterium]
MNYKVKLKDINTFIFDYDGVISDGYIYTANDDIIMRSGNVKDGYAIQYAIKKGYNIVIISGGSGKSIETRMRMLGVRDVFISAGNKLEIYYKYCKEHNLERKNILYMGDDIPDYDIMQNVGVATCPADAACEIKQIADYISDKKGGQGCVRDIVEQVLKLHNKWFNEDSKEW